MINLLSDIETYLKAKGEAQAASTDGFVCVECTALLKRVRLALDAAQKLVVAGKYVVAHTVPDDLRFNLTFPYDPQCMVEALAGATDFEDQT